MKRTQTFAVLLAALMGLMLLCGCGANTSEPCVGCRNTPTRGYENKATGEKDYYCDGCADDCAFCSEKATKHYTNGFEEIVFVCKDCYEDILEINS